MGNRIRLGGLIEVAENRLKEDIICIDDNFDIKKQENDILLNSRNAGFIVYDTENYLNDADEIIGIIRRIYRANRATPVILVPTDNPRNEIIKTAVDSQIKSFVNTSRPMGEQKNQFEKILTGFYRGNEDETVTAAEELLSEESQEIKNFVTDLYDAKQREEKRESTVIIKQKGTTEVLITSSVTLFKTVINIIVYVLAVIGIATLLYSDIRYAFMLELDHVIEVLMNMLPGR